VTAANNSQLVLAVSPAADLSRDLIAASFLLRFEAVESLPVGTLLRLQLVLERDHG